MLLLFRVIFCYKSIIIHTIPMASTCPDDENYNDTMATPIIVFVDCPSPRPATELFPTVDCPSPQPTTELSIMAIPIVDCPSPTELSIMAIPIVDCPSPTELSESPSSMAIPIVDCPPHHHLTTELQPPEPPSIPFSVLSPLALLPRTQSVASVTTASPYRSPSPPPACECCRILLGMKVGKGPKIMC